MVIFVTKIKCLIYWINHLSRRSSKYYLTIQFVPEREYEHYKDEIVNVV